MTYDPSPYELIISIGLIIIITLLGIALSREIKYKFLLKVLTDEVSALKRQISLMDIMWAPKIKPASPSSRFVRSLSRQYPFEVDDEVCVPEPIEGDIHEQAFIGTVLGEFFSNKTPYIVVEDQENNSFCIEPERLTLHEY